MKKLEIEKTKPTFIIAVLKVDIIKVGLVFSISNFFITKTSLANEWTRKKNTFLYIVIQLCEIFNFGKDRNIVTLYNFLLLMNNMLLEI